MSKINKPCFALMIIIFIFQTPFFLMWVLLKPFEILFSGLIKLLCFFIKKIELFFADGL